MPNPDFSIILNNFSKGRRTLPIQGSFFASRGLNPFIEKGVITSEHFLKEEANSGVLTNLTNVHQFATRSGKGYAKSQKYIYEEVSGSWTLKNTDANANTKDHLGMVIEPHASNLHAFSDTKILKWDGGSWAGDLTWKTGLEAEDHYVLTIRNWTLFSNGRYVGGWSTSDGADFNLQMLDLAEGYKTKRLLMYKAQGIRMVMIRAIYPTDRTKDGIFFWDLSSEAPLDFIPIPWLHDFWIENNIVYALHGHNIDISQVILETGQLRWLNSVLHQPHIGTTAITVKFLGKWSNLLLISADGERDPSVSGDGFYPGLWAYEIVNNAMFYWLSPSTKEFLEIHMGAVLITENNLWVASKSTKGAIKKYYIDKLTKVTSGSGNFYEMLVSPILDAGSINQKEWKKIKTGHNKLATGSRMEIKYRDFSRDLCSASGLNASAVTNDSISAKTKHGEIGDEITIIHGTGAGQSRHIIDIDETVNFKYVVDRDWDTNPVQDVSEFEINSWKEIDFHDKANKEIHGKFSGFMDKDIDNQIKINLKHTNAQSIKIRGTRAIAELQPEE